MNDAATAQTACTIASINLTTARDTYHAAKAWANAEELDSLRNAYHAAREIYWNASEAYEREIS